MRAPDRFREAPCGRKRRDVDKRANDKQCFPKHLAKKECYAGENDALNSDGDGDGDGDDNDTITANTIMTMMTAMIVMTLTLLEMMLNDGDQRPKDLTNH